MVRQLETRGEGCFIKVLWYVHKRTHKIFYVEHTIHILIKNYYLLFIHPLMIEGFTLRSKTHNTLSLIKIPYGKVVRKISLVLVK